MTEICVLSFKPLANDPRIYRQVKWLSPDYDVYTLGPADTAIQGITCVDMGYRPQNNFLKALRGASLLTGRHETFYWLAPHIKHSWRRLQQLKPPIIVANELECWPLAVKAKAMWNCKIILDAHEFYPGMYSEDLKWRVLFGKFTRTMCQQTLAHADGITTVSETLCDYYERDFGRRPTLITNAPFYKELTTSQTQNDRIRIIHHGHLMPSRSPEIFIEAMKHVKQNVELTFMFKVDPSQKKYEQAFRQQAAQDSRIHFRDPVPMTEIPKTINQYDVGIHLLPPVNPNHQGALPNKFFEFIQARLAVLFSPNPEVSRMIKTHELGIVSQGFSARELGEAINMLTPEKIRACKENAHKASQILCAENNEKRFRELIQAVLT